jgi:hypothetical protein
MLADLEHFGIAELVDTARLVDADGFADRDFAEVWPMPVM